MDELESVGLSISRRLKKELGYADEVRPFIREFVAESARRTALSGGALPSYEVLGLWGAMLSKMEAAGVPQTLVTAFTESSLPGKTAEALTHAVGESTALGLRGDGVQDFLFKQLGLTGSEPGKMVTGEGLSRNWVADIETVANTSATADFATEMLAELEAEGYPLKRWSTRADDRVRPTHRHADMQTLSLAEPFVVGGELLRFPGDPDGTWAETANCRCVIVGVMPGDREWDFPPGVEPWNDPRPANL